MRSARRLAHSLSIAACVLLATACTSGDKDAPRPDVEVARSDGGAIDWRRCDEAECASIYVPLDYSDPDGDQIEIALLRRKADRTEDWRGVLLLNPGGPGASGLSMARDAEYIFPRELLDRFDIVGFDPRGVGESTAVDCGDDFDDEYPEDYTPDTESERDALVDDAKEFADACRRHSGDLLPHITTANAARDMDLVREALGVERISFLGQSYGALLGTYYAEMFPEHVRAFVLDGALDPELSVVDWRRQQARAIEGELEAFLNDCGEHRACDFHSGGDPRAAFDVLMERIEDDPLPAEEWDEGVELVPDDAVGAVITSLYDRDAWVGLAWALSSADRENDGSRLLDLAYPYSEPEESDNYAEANAAFECGDTTERHDENFYHDLSTAFLKDAPRVGAVSAYWSLVCAFWPEPLSEPPTEFDAKGAPLILVVGTRHDPATPYEGARALARQLDRSALLTWEGHGHLAAFYNVSSCIDEAVLIYLVDLEPPTDGKDCD